MSKILIVEDNKNLVTGLAFNLEAQGFTTCAAYDGEEALQAAEKEKPDLVILDIMLPKKDGFQVCRELREKGIEVPVLMLTARGKEADKVMGFELGADDYLAKPFGILELLARVKALLRRREKKILGWDRIRFGDVDIDFRTHTTTWSGQPIDLTPREYEIMALLVENRGKVVSRTQFLDRIWGYDRYPSTRTVDVHLAKLRQKLEPNPASPQYILTVHGLGYKFIG